MFEKIYYNETNLDDEGNFTVDITNDDAVNKKKFLAGEEYLVSVVLIKAVRSNDLTKYSNFDKIKMLSEKINDSNKNLKRFDWFNHDSFFGWKTKSAMGRKPEAGKSTRNKNLQILQHKNNEKRSDNVWRLWRIVFEQKN